MKASQLQIARAQPGLQTNYLQATEKRELSYEWGVLELRKNFGIARKTLPKSNDQFLTLPLSTVVSVGCPSYSLSWSGGEHANINRTETQ
jgi:hypothetical protein